MRRLVKRILMWFCALVFRDQGPKVIYYHDVGTRYTRMGTSLSIIKEHLATAQKLGYDFISSFEELLESSSKGEKKLLLCFDDGYRGLWDEREYFVCNNLHPLVFLAVDLVGKEGFLTWDEIVSLQDRGFSFQCHTWSHQTLAGSAIETSPKGDRTDSWFERELKKSKEVISRKLGEPVTALCLPAGHFSNEALEKCVEAGYKTVYSSIPGKLNSLQSHVEKIVGNNRLKFVPRHLCQSFSKGEFALMLKGALGGLARRYWTQHYSS